MTQQAPHSAGRPSGRPGRMTSVMRAVSQQAGPKILRIGVVQGGKVMDERLIKQRTHVTVGPSEKAVFVVPSRKIPSQFKLFELIGQDYYLNYLDGMTGRVALKTGISDLTALRSQAKTVSEKGVTFNRVRLTEDSRGKVVIGETTFLFQFVVPPPVQPKPQLPVSVQKGVAGDIDWFTTIVAAFSFLLHFFVVALVYSDWMDPIVDDEVTVTQLIESIKSLPPPPPLEKPTQEVDPKATAAATGDADAPKAVAKPSGGGQGSGPKTPTTGGGSKAEANAKAAEIASQLAELDVQTVGALGGGGVATEGVLSSGDVPAGLLDEAGRSEAGAGTGDPGGLKGIGGSGKGGTGPLGGGNGKNLSDIGERGQSGGNDGGATKGGKEKGPKGPVGNVAGIGAGVSGGKIAGAAGVVGRMRGRFKACYQAGLNQNPDMQGSVTLVLTIGENGAVRSVGGGGGGSLGPIVGCLKAVAQSGMFAPPEGGSAVVSVPITFVKQ